jgi:phage-related protein
MKAPSLKPLRWVASAKRDLAEMPDAVQDSFGFALYLAQIGQKHEKARPLHGFGSAGVLEVVEDAKGGTYRAIYTVRIAEAVYVLHCFQKKSVRGIQTPKPDMDLIQERLKAVEMLSKGKRK